MADLILDVDFSKVSRAIDELSRLGKLSADTNKGMAQATRLVVQWQEKFAAQQGRVNAEIQKGILKQDLANKSARESAAAFEEYERRIEQLTLKYKPLYAASMQYEAALNELNEAHQHNILSVEQHAQAVDRLNKEYTQFQSGTAGWENQFVRGSTRAGKSMNKFGMYAQQVGYQVGDFFVQVQSGQNVFVAFGQQATQLAGLLPGVAGAIAGIGISIGTMLLSMWSRSKEAEGGINNLASALKTAREDSSKFADEIERLNKGLEDTAELTFVRSIQQEKENLKKLKEQFGEGDALSGDVEKSLLAAQEAKVAAAEKELELYKSRRKEAGALKDAEEQKADAQEAYLQAQIDLQSEVEKALWELHDLDLRLAAKAKAKKEEMTKNEIDVMTDSINTYLEAYVAGQKGAYDETVRIAAFAAKMREDSAKKEQSYANKAKEDQIEILKLEGKIGEARQLSVKLAGEKAAQEVYSKFTQEELLRMTEAEKSVLAQAAGEAAKNAEEAEKTAIALDNAKNKAQGLADNLKEAVSAMSGLSSFGDSLDKALAVSIAKVQALKAGADAAVAGDIAGKRAELSQKAKEGLAKGVPLATVMAEIDSSAAKIDKLEASEKTRKKLEEDARNAAKKGSTADSLKSGTEYIERVLKPEIELRQKSLFLSDEQQKRAKFEFDLRQKLDKYKDKASEKEIAAVMALYDQTVRLERASRLIDYAQGQMEDFFMSVVDGTSTIEDAFKGMLRNILLEIYKQQVVEPISTGISGFLKGLLGGVGGSSLAPSSSIRPPVKAFATGGVVSAPTLFPMANGAGLMGEAGPEAIMPLKRGANGKLGVEMHGGSSQQVIVNQSFNFSANGDESVKKIIAQAAPQIAQMTQQKIMDSRRRGGQMKATFS